MQKAIKYDYKFIKLFKIFPFVVASIVPKLLSLY